MAESRWPSVYLETFRAFKDYSNREVERVRRNLNGLSNDDKEALVWPLEEQVKAMEEGVAANLAVLEKIQDIIKQAQAPEAKLVDLPVGAKPVQTLLQTLTREWSTEGRQERNDCFTLLLGALSGHLQGELEKHKASGSPPPKVLCPGASLGRLPYEIQKLGYECSGCEAQVLRYFTTEFIRQTGDVPEVHQIQPFVVNTCNRLMKKDHVRVTAVPEVAASGTNIPPIRFGDFLYLYDSAAELAAYDAVLTAFTVDSSPNIFRFVRTVAHVVRPGGVWANFGPLAYDTDHDDDHGSSVELSWEELRFAVSHFFEIQEESFVDALHAANAESMMQMQFRCVYFKAVRNNVVSAGIGK